MKPFYSVNNLSNLEKNEIMKPKLNYFVINIYVAVTTFG